MRTHKKLGGVGVDPAPQWPHLSTSWQKMRKKNGFARLVTGGEGADDKGAQSMWGGSRRGRGRCCCCESDVWWVDVDSTHGGAVPYQHRCTHPQQVIWSAGRGYDYVRTAWIGIHLLQTDSYNSRKISISG